MKKIPLAFFISLLLTSDPLMAGVMRHDISVQDYRDFGENRGKFRPGNLNVPLYRKDLTLDSYLPVPMPDFSAVNRLGYATLIAPSLVVGVRHNGGYKNVTWGNKEKFATSYTLINRNNYAVADFHAPRLHKVVTETPTMEYVTRQELQADPTRYSWYARVGTGTQKAINDDKKSSTTLAYAYQWRTGGLIKGTDVKLDSMLRWTMNDHTPLAIGTEGGDSGSPILAWDSVDKRWKLAAVLMSISGSADYNRRNNAHYMQVGFIDDVLAAMRDPDVQDLAADGVIAWKNAALYQGNKRWDWHGLTGAAASEAPDKASAAALDATKDLRFNGEGGTIVLEQAVNMGAAKLQFSADYLVRSLEGQQATWAGGGVEVDKDRTVEWQINGLQGDALHKIGAGTLHVHASGVNQGGLNVGDGTVVLDQQADANGNKLAFSQITLVSGRPTVVLGDAGQVNSSDIRFGYRGGTLDLNGNALSFDQILHNDEGARIVSRDASQRATLTLTGDKQIFLGEVGEQKSLDRLNLNYDPQQGDASWQLAGGAYLHEVNVARGQLQLSGAQVLQANRVSNEWEAKNYQLSTLNLAPGASLLLGEHATLSTAATLLADATLALHGRTTLNGSVTLADAGSTLDADIAPRGSTAGELASVINANISGAGKINKSGQGLLTLNGSVTTLSDFSLQEGELQVNGILTSPLKMAEGSWLSGTGKIDDVVMANNAVIAPGNNLVKGSWASMRLGSLHTGQNPTLLLNSAFTSSSTDRLLISGDLATHAEAPLTVSIAPQGSWENTDSNGNGRADNREGLSLIQVAGQARADSVKLAGSYVARGPWAYGLYAFAPGRSAESERLVDGEGDQYWDYRLQNILLSTGDNAQPALPEPAPVPDPEPVANPEPETPKPQPKPIRRAVTPQVPGYISLPAAMKNYVEKRSALFMESALRAAEDPRSNFILSGFHGEDRYRSANGFIDYGYDFRSKYTGWMMGGKLLSLSDARQTLSLTTALSRGTLSVTPDAKDGVSTGNYTSWGVDALLAWQHQNGLHFDLPFGYTRTRGNISTELRGRNVAGIGSHSGFIGLEAGKAWQKGAHRWQPLLGMHYTQQHISRFTDGDGAKVSYKEHSRPDYLVGMKYHYRNENVTYPFGLGTEVRYTRRSDRHNSVTIGSGNQQANFATGNGGDNLQIKASSTVEINDNVSLSAQVHHQRRLQKEGVTDWAMMGGIAVTF